VCEEGVIVWRKKGDTSRTIWREIRPEHSIVPDDDLYESPRSWMGAALAGGKESGRVSGADAGQRAGLAGEPFGPAPAWQLEPGPSRRQEPRRASALTFQTAVSIFLLAAVFLLFHSQRTIAHKIQTVVREAMNTDYTSVELPAHVAAMFGAIPSSGSATIKTAAPGLYVVSPMRGTIIRGYSVVSPEVVILGRPGSPVDAAADGLVDAVGESQANGLYVTIDHGSFGQTFYAHLGRLVVHDHEYVTAGQLIGYLPGESGRLTFGYIQDGSYKDPRLILHAGK
jgi:hypothetical protein